MSGPIVLVTWHDAWADEDDVDDDTIEQEHGPVEVQSVGFLRKQDKRGVTLVGCVDEDQGRHRRLFIPAAMVVSVKRLK